MVLRIKLYQRKAPHRSFSLTQYGCTQLESMTHSRTDHVAFKMKDNIYVVGGRNENDNLLSSCERYDLKERWTTRNRWHVSPHNLPYPVFMASIVVREDECLAILSGGFRYRQHGYIGHSIIHTIYQRLIDLRILDPQVLYILCIFV